MESGISLAGATIGFGVGIIVSIFSPEWGPKVGRAIEKGAAIFGDWIETAFDWVGDVVEWVFGLVASGLLWLDDFFRCRFGVVTGGSKPPAPTSFNDIRHVFVLMLENRSFDHLLGLLPGVDGWTLGAPRSNTDLNVGVRSQDDDANQSLNVDPPHEFSEVQLTLNAGRDTNGFAKVWHRKMLDETGGASAPEIEQILAGFGPERAPILNQLAAEFAVCDRWFCSVPGPTYPNRLFAYAGDSGGMATSPKSISLATAYVDGISFKNGTFFDLLDHNCHSWRIYRGDAFPMVNTLKHVWCQDTFPKVASNLSFT
jgi:phospholipase C